MMSIYSRGQSLIAMGLIITLTLVSACKTTTVASDKSTVQPTEMKPALKNYISLDLAYPNYKLLLDKLEHRLGHSLKSRGEAHITLITPPEYKSLTQKLTPEQIHQEASEFFATEPKFTNECLGQFVKSAEPAKPVAYYVVVSSTEMLQFRKKLADKAGLSRSDFDPELFFPHVTLGFTDRDLHFEDGARKDKNSCPTNLKSIMRER